MAGFRPDLPERSARPHDPDNLSHTFSRIAGRAGRGHWHIHELRHSGASLMLAQGTHLYVVSEVLGHSSVAITKEVYEHLAEGHKRSAAVLMSRALLSDSGSPVATRKGPTAPQPAKPAHDEG